MVVIIFLTILQLSCAAVPMMRNIMDPIMEIDDVGGFLYDIPEDEDPLIIQQKLSSIGAMPIFRMLESAMKQGNSKDDDISENMRIAESKRVIDEAISRLELARSKLEKGNANIATEKEKVIQSLKTLGETAHPDVDIRQVLNSLQSVIAMARPIKMSEIKDLITTSDSQSTYKNGFLEKPQSYDSQALRVRVISDVTPSFDDKSTEGKIKPPATTDVPKERSGEKPKPPVTSEMPKQSFDERVKSSMLLEKPTDNLEVTKSPFEFKMKENKNTNFDGEDMTSSYKAKMTWKAAAIV